MIARVLTLGEGLGVLRSRDIGSFETVSELILSTGGAEANVAIGLARLGADVTWLGRVGDDAIGRRVTRNLRAEGVDVVATIDHEAPTGVILKSSPSAGRTEVINLRTASAGSRLNVADLDAIDIALYDVLHLTGITPALSISAAAALTELLGRARSANVLVSVDVNHRSRLWNDPAAAIASHLALIDAADIVFAGDDEAELLVGPANAPEELAERLAARGPLEVVIKRGALGALAMSNGIVHSCAAYPVSVVDTVGAGDGFVAGYLAELLRGRSIPERLELARRAGSAACANPGDWEGAPTRAELDLVHTDPVMR